MSSQGIYSTVRDQPFVFNDLPVQQMCSAICLSTKFKSGKCTNTTQP